MLSDLLSTAGYIWALVLVAKKFSRRGVSFEAATGLFWRELSPAHGALAAAGGLGLGFAISALIALLPLPSGWLEGYDTVSVAAFEGRGRILAVLIAVAITPLCEEILFRGFLLRTMTQAFSPRFSIAATAAVFGLLHVNPLWIVYAFAMGLFFGWMACRLGNLALPICAHMGFNLSALPGIYASNAINGPDFSPGPLLAAAVLAGGAALAAAAFYRLISQSPKQEPDGDWFGNGSDSDDSSREKGGWTV
jgi:membrane protease YdiL (CAAX protease family)